MISAHDEGNQGRPPKPPEIPEKLMAELYSLSGWYLQEEPWEKMADFQPIVIVDPDTGARQLAVVMGRAKTLFAIHLYQPEEGTRWYTHLNEAGPSTISAHDAQFDHRYLEIQ